MSLYSSESREIELEAIARLRRFYSSDHKIIDLGQTDRHDIEIHHSKNGLVGIGEVTWLEDPIKKSAWNALVQQKDHHIIPLNTGQGFWSMSIKHSANLNLITRKLPGLISLMLKDNQTERQIYETWPNDPISTSLRDFGIEYLRKVENQNYDRDECFFLFEGSGGLIPQSLEPLADFVLELLNSKFLDCLRKLEIEGDLDRHLYLKMGSYLPFNLVEPLARKNPIIEIGKFNFPNGISHIWLIAANENFRSVLWHKGNQYLD